ncbi:MAG: hypothetical protein U0586_08910 [Candidatus Brocadiaceae bacterium]
MHVDGTQHVVIASGAKQSFPINKFHLLIRSKWDCETLRKKEVLHSNTITTKVVTTNLIA